MARDMTFVAALKHFFEIEAGEMVREYKALSDTDKAELRELLIAEGYTLSA